MSEQLKAFERGKAPARTTYTYDAKGRLTKKSDRNMVFEHTTTILYNEHGDKAGQRETFKDNSAGPEHLPHVPPDSDVRYDFRYDSYGNWIERIEKSAPIMVRIPLSPRSLHHFG